MRRRVIVWAVIVLLLSGCSGSGDRVLVSKFNYDSGIDPPHRFDVVVFKFPERPIENGTPKNYIKRLIGLPGELIAIFFGQLFCLLPTGPGAPDGIDEKEWTQLTDTTDINKMDLWKINNVPRDHGAAAKAWKDGSFKIVHKPLPVMLALSRPVYDNDHPAADLKGILPPRWGFHDGSIWAADEQNGFTLSAAGAGEHWLHYRHILRPSDWPAKDDPNRKATIDRIRQSKYLPELITDFLGYNTYRVAGHPDPGSNWVGDLMLECSLTVQEPKGEVWIELGKGIDRFQAKFDLATGKCSLYRWSEHKTKEVVDNGVKKQVPDWQQLATAPTSVHAKGTYVLRFANYDQRLTLWVGSDTPFGEGHAYPAVPLDKAGPDQEPGVGPDGNLDQIKNNDLQPVSLCAVGANVAVKQLKLFRNTYYTDKEGPGRVNGDDLKNPDRWGPLRDARVHTWYVYPGHYFCLGDNSPESSDGRYWGLVPERLMLGRALVVYYPFDRAGLIK
jgi:signal peptidase I